VDSAEQTHLHNQTRGELICLLYMYILLCAYVVMETRQRWWRYNTINYGGDAKTSKRTYFVSYPFFFLSNFFLSLSNFYIYCDSDSIFLSHSLLFGTTCSVKSFTFELMKRTFSYSIRVTLLLGFLFLFAI